MCWAHGNWTGALPAAVNGNGRPAPCSPAVDSWEGLSKGGPYTGGKPHFCGPGLGGCMGEVEVIGGGE